MLSSKHFFFFLSQESFQRKQGRRPKTQRKSGRNGGEGGVNFNCIASYVLGIEIHVFPTSGTSLSGPRPPFSLLCPAGTGAFEEEFQHRDKELIPVFLLFLAGCFPMNSLFRFPFLFCPPQTALLCPEGHQQQLGGVHRVRFPSAFLDSNRPASSLGSPGPEEAAVPCSSVLFCFTFVSLSSLIPFIAVPYIQFSVKMTNMFLFSSLASD